MITANELLFLMPGIAYGVSIMGVAMTWMMAITMEWIKHDNTRGTDGVDIYEVTRPSIGRIFYVVIASTLWPLSLLLLVIYGILRLPICIYRKTGK